MKKARNRPRRGRGGAFGKRGRKKKAGGPFHSLKLEVAGELGLAQKIRRSGWGGLTSAESGRIGGVMTRRLRALGLVPNPPRRDRRRASSSPGVTSSEFDEPR
ncbi:MAG: alpha/beta-type small acid-soluble spore protein [Firmicutes bacterium]|nr:alpha/beta-type small acid-soluble spore protein [Bacillota bacterium]